MTQHGNQGPSAGKGGFRRERVLFHGDNHCEIQALDPEICLFENTYFFQVKCPFSDSLFILLIIIAI